MVFVVSKDLPLATFQYIEDHEDIKANYIKIQFNIFLVGSLLDSGKIFVEFAKICAFAGAILVDQSQMTHMSDVKKSPARYGSFSIKAPQFSANQFTAKGTTDTGNHLFIANFLS